MSISSHSRDIFSMTRWSVVLRLATDGSGDPGDPLTDLVQRFRYPVYIFVRRCGHAPAVAQDVTRRFLAHLIRQFRDSHAHPRSHFRGYLLEQLAAFLGGDWHASTDPEGAEAMPVSPDLETRYQREIGTTISADQAYQQGFAMEFIARSLTRLRAEAQQSGHLAMYEALQPFLAHEPGPGEYDAMAAGLRTRPLALVVALKRLRQRFRDLVGQELADTVTSAEDLAAEQAALHDILRKVCAPA